MRTGLSIALVLIAVLAAVFWAVDFTTPDGRQPHHMVQSHGACDTQASEHAAGHMPDLARHREHSAALDLVALCSETHLAVRSGDWSAPATWAEGKPPAANARVRIPSGLTVKVDREIPAKIDWIRVMERWSGAPIRQPP